MKARFDRMLHKRGHDPATAEVGIHVGAINVPIGIQLEESGDLRFQNGDKRPLEFTAFLPVTRIGLRGRPSKTLLRRVVFGCDFVNRSGEDLRDRKVVTVLVNSDHIFATFKVRHGAKRGRMDDVFSPQNREPKTPMSKGAPMRGSDRRLVRGWGCPPEKTLEA